MINFLYKAVMKHEVIYSLYGAIHVNWRTTENQIITIRTEELKWSKDKEEFYYIWVGLNLIIILIVQKITEKFGLF